MSRAQKPITQIGSDGVLFCLQATANRRDPKHHTPISSAKCVLHLKIQKTSFWGRIPPKEHFFEDHPFG